VTDDTADAMFEHYLTLNQWMVEPSVVRRYCDLAAPTLEWLMDLGVVFPPERVYRSGIGSTPRGHQPQGEGAAVVAVLEAHRASRGVDLVLDARVDALLRSEQGAITGIRSGNDEASCAAVVIAAGGFGANPELLAEHYPDAAAAGNWSWYIGSPMARGDGLKLGSAVGAAIDGHNRGLLLVTPGFSRDLEVLLPGWLILVNQQGRRFADETASYTVLGGLIKQQGGRAFAVFDEPARAAARRTPFSQAFWVDEVLAQKAEDGTIARADTLADLAARIEVDGAALPVLTAPSSSPARAACGPSTRRLSTGSRCGRPLSAGREPACGSMPIPGCSAPTSGRSRDSLRRERRLARCTAIVTSAAADPSVRASCSAGWPVRWRPPLHSARTEIDRHSAPCSRLQSP
jgi:fumarate reductase flavoprotein subunit